MNLDRLANSALRRGYGALLRPAMFRMYGGDPEPIHELMIDALAHVPARRCQPNQPQVTIAGIDFPRKVGVAAGLDKDGRAAAAWAWFGFGFAELGTVTARPQPGNDRPRLFRAKASRAIINRMGFNNAGAQKLALELAGRGVQRGNNALGIPLGISIGKSKVTPLEESHEDYLFSLRALAAYADYIAINVSSPNTPGLRSLQEAAILASLATALTDEAANLDADNPVPIFVKVAPDLAESDVTELLAALADVPIAGYIATNTTLSRAGLVAADHALAAQAGGLSGRPLTGKALRFVGDLRRHTDRPIIGSGGIMTPADARRMLEAGADLVQVYTGFIYEGPALVHGINTLI